MGTMTMVEFIKRTRDELVAGVVEDIYTLNPLFSAMPWDGFSGSSISVNRETTIGDAQILDVGDAITAKTASAVTKVNFEPTTLLGDAEINKLQVAMSSSDMNDVEAMEISSKAKAVGRLIQSGMAGVSGDANAALFNSMHSLIDSSQYTASAGVGGAILSFARLDELLSLIDSKEGSVDWIQMAQRDFNQFKVLLRGLGGTPADWVVELPDGRTTLGYEGIPIFVNRWLSIVETDDGAALTGGAQSSIYAGNWDDGSRKIGATMIHPEAVDAGVVVEPIGAKEAKDEDIWRVKSYCNFAIFNRRGIARMTGVKTG